MLKEILLDILLPKRCLGCGREGKYICDNCEIFLNELPFSPEVISLWEYEGLMEKLIQRIKYQGQFNIIDELIEKTFEKITLTLPDNTYITYVPIYQRKEKQRGFNQAKLIAQKIGEITNQKVLSLLISTRNTRSQNGLTLEERVENVRGHFLFHHLLRYCLRQFCW